MATLELCDLCSGKTKNKKCSIEMCGSIPNFKNGIPPPPPGFKYADDYESRSKQGTISYQKVWDKMGRVIRETKYIKPHSPSY